jgi:hypothetical protein
MTLEEVYKRTGEYDDTLRTDDPRFERSVLLVHGDGSILIVNQAFLMRYEDWIIVFSQHHSFHAYAHDKLVSYAEYIQQYNLPERLP